MFIIEGINKTITNICKIFKYTWIMCSFCEYRCIQCVGLIFRKSARIIQRSEFFIRCAATLEITDLVIVASPSERLPDGRQGCSSGRASSKLQAISGFYIRCSSFVIPRQAGTSAIAPASFILPFVLPDSFSIFR